MNSYCGEMHRQMASEINFGVRLSLRADSATK